MAWANDKFFTALSQLPPAAWAHTYDNGEWNVGRIAMHIVTGQEWYRFVLNGTLWQDVQQPTSADDMISLRDYVAELDRTLLDEANKPDALIKFDDEGESRSAHRSTVLGQAVHHCTEHRAQIAAALESHGIRLINLDDLDLWAYENEKG